MAAAATYNATTRKTLDIGIRLQRFLEVHKDAGISIFYSFYFRRVSQSIITLKSPLINTSSSCRMPFPQSSKAPHFRLSCRAQKLSANLSTNVTYIVFQ
jgi:hypothetical protein